MKTIYNEGRVVGFSSWEIYMRQALQKYPNIEPANEREWLAASIGGHNSMVLKIAAGTLAGSHDYVLPADTDLCGCSVMTATLFEGAVTIGEDGLWAQNVSDYGPLISNVVDRYPSTPGEPSDVPTKEDSIIHSPEYSDQCHEFVKIVDGLVIQPGEWVDNVVVNPIENEEDQNVLVDNDDLLLASSTVASQGGFKVLKPDLTKSGFIRLGFSKPIEHDFYILFTGFVFKTIMAGANGFLDPFEDGKPYNGDFLGPQMYPWATKIMFLAPIDFIQGYIQDIRTEMLDIGQALKEFLATGSYSFVGTMEEIEAAIADGTIQDGDLVYCIDN